MIYARALELQNRNDEAAEEYRRLIPYFAGEEARARLGLLLERMGRRDEAREVFAQIAKHLDGAPQRYRKAQREWGEVAARALKA